MTKKIDWLNHFLEFIVVIIGILIAFQLNAYSIRKSQEETINMHLAQIEEEVKFNIRSIKVTIELHELNLQKLDTISQLMASENNLNKINKLSLDLLNVGAVYFRKNAYISFSTSGDIRNMQKFSVKQKIVNLYEYYKWVELTEKILLDNYNKRYLPFLIDHFDLTTAKVQNPDLYYSQKFKNILAAYSHTLTISLERNKACLVEMEKYSE